jgi:Ca2+/Na+ antiporter
VYPVWKVLLFIGIIAFAVAFVRELLNWTAGRQMISRKQQVYRMLISILTIKVFLLILFGDRVPISNPITFMLYWMGCFVLVCMVVVLTLLDLKEVGNRYREQHRNMMRQISEE